jgi:acyl-CoA synthetase (AMP-forming)/AMP-acid ligase II
VQDVAVIGVPEAKWGESVQAVVVLRAAEAASEAELLDWCKGRIASFKRPKSVVFIAESQMPRTATGKIQHRVLRDRLAKAAPAA